MKKLTVLFLTLIVTISCEEKNSKKQNVNTSDIDLFWNVYDQVIQEKDSLQQVELIQTEYIDKGSIGLEKIIQVRNYSAEQYVELINKYPRYWNSIRSNTLKVDSLTNELNQGIAKLKNIYPKMKPAKIYFTIGAMRTNGTTMDSLVLIGSELAMADTGTDISEFEGRTKEWLETYFETNPIDGLVLLNVHEYVHTQQNQVPNNLLYQVLYEGVAEFVSVKAMKKPSDVPAIAFGKNNPKVKETFEKEMFFERTSDWMWSNSTNKFNVRDLGYYIGYAIAEKHYNKAEDKQKAIATLIELDYSKAKEIDKFINQTSFFSKPIEQLRKEFEQSQPTVISIQPFENGSQSVNIKTNQLTIKFSEPMIHRRNFDFGPLGEDAVVRFKNEIGYSENDTKYTFEIEELKPDKRYQITIGSGFQSRDSIPLRPYLIDFKTSDQ